MTRTAGTRLRAARALLAGGVVLGLGAVVTAAAWSDRETAAATFTAATFATESYDEASQVWSHHADGNPVVLASDPVSLVPGGTQAGGGTFTPAPGPSRYLRMGVRTTTASTVDGVVSVDRLSVADPLGEVVEYRVVTITSGACDTAFTAGATYLAGGPGAYVPANQPVTGASTAPVGKNGIGLCIDLRLGAGATDTTSTGAGASTVYQGASGGLTLTLSVASTS